jgi:hypothetical protein
MLCSGAVALFQVIFPRECEEGSKAVIETLLAAMGSPQRVGLFGHGMREFGASG